MFDFSIDTGVNAIKPIDWEKLFLERSKVHDVTSTQQLDQALRVVKPTEGIRVAPGTYTGADSRRTISQPDVIVGPLKAGKHGERTATFSGGQFGIAGARSIVGGIRFTSSGVAPANMIIISAPGVRLEDFDLVDINTKTEKSRVLLVDRRAHDVRIRQGLITDSTGYTVVLDSPRGEGIAQRVSVSYCTFARCSAYYFQAGQWGNEIDQSFGEFAYNQVRDSEAAELKVSDFFTHHNSFYRVNQGFNFRIGNRNVLERNRFDGGRRACRVFGGDHKIIGNIVVAPELWSLIIAEGSLQEQFRELPNAHHVAAARVVIEDNLLQHGTRGGILIGDRQTGMRGVGKRGASGPDSRDWPHYEPYSPSDITVRKNTIFGQQGLSVALRRPDTRPATSDQYINHPTLNRYTGVRIHENNFLLSPGASSGLLGGDQYGLWREHAETWDNTEEPIEVLSRL